MPRFLSLVLLMGVGILGGSLIQKVKGNSTHTSTDAGKAVINTPAATSSLESSTLSDSIQQQTPKPSTTTGVEVTPATSSKATTTTKSDPQPKTSKPSTTTQTSGDCPLFFCSIKEEKTLLLVGALSLTCLILLTATLTLACNICALKKKMVFTVQTTRRESVDCETGPMIMKAGKQEEDGNQSGPEWPEGPEEPEKPDEPVVEAAEATEDSNQAPAEDSTLLPPPADEAPPNQECETSGEVTLDAAEQ